MYSGAYASCIIAYIKQALKACSTNSKAIRDKVASKFWFKKNFRHRIQCSLQLQKTVPITNSIRAPGPYTFCIFWIFGIFTDDCLDSNFRYLSAYGSRPCSNCPHDQFNPYPLQFFNICIFTDDCLDSHLNVDKVDIQNIQNV